MSNIITNEQKDIIANLAKGMNSNERNALVNFGAQMYRDGIIKGTIATMIGIGMGAAAYCIVKRNSKEADDLQ